MLKTLVLAALGFVCVATAAPAHAGDGTDLLKFAPETSQLVMVFDVADARDSALLQKGFGKLLDASAEAKAKLAELGLDPMKDIDTVMLAGGGGLDLGEVKDMVIVVEGRLPRDKLATTPGVVKSTYLGTTIYAKQESEVAFIGDRLFFTKKGKMKAAIDIALNKGKGKGKSVAASKKAKLLRTAIAATDTTADLWATVIVPAKAQTDMKAQGVVAQTVSIGLSFSADLAIALKVGTDSADSATKVTGMIQGQLAQLSQVAGTMGLSKAAKSLLVTSAGAAVNIGLTMTEAELLSVMALVKQSAGSGTP